MKACFALLVAMLFSCSIASAKLVEKQWTVEGTQRTANIYLPDSAIPKQGWPIVFIFHGHGGNSKQVARTYRMEEAWPEAVVVYPQGLPTKGQITDPQGKLNGWSCDSPADKNRDILFFDAMLKSIEADYKIDATRVFVGGHSNGGSFSYALWAMRPDVITAFAPSSAVRGDASLKPKPVIMSGGTKDPLVKWAWQDKMMQVVRRIDKTTGDGKSWGKDATWYDSSDKTPVVTVIYDGGHAPPADIGELVAKFFKTIAEQQKT